MDIVCNIYFLINIVFDINVPIYVEYKLTSIHNKYNKLKDLSYHAYQFFMPIYHDEKKCVGIDQTWWLSLTGIFKIKANVLNLY